MLPIQHIPKDPGIYIFKNKKNQILYIGKAKNLQKRVSQYFTPGSVWKQDMVAQATNIEFVHVNNESEAIYLESNLIRKHQPPYNNLLKADNSYVYIKIPKEDFPPILITRYKTNDGSTYIGPKHHTRELKNFLQYLRLLYKYRTSKKTEFTKGVLSSDFYFGLDEGRSVISKLKNKNSQSYIDHAAQRGLILDKPYEYYQQLYKKIIKAISEFFKGDTKQVEQDILEQIQNAINKQNFERAAKLRDILQHIHILTEKQSIESHDDYSGYIRAIHDISQRSVYCILHIHKGKVIDIIRSKVSHEDTDHTTLISTFIAEYGQAQLRYHSHKKRDIRIPTDIIPEEIIGTVSTQKIKKRQFKNRIELIKKSIQDYIIASSFEKESMMNTILKDLQQRYGLRTFPYRIECIDISHLSGAWMSGGLSCLLGGLPYPKGYRKYKIKSVKTLDQQNNDYKALEEVLLRRFDKSNPSPKPDLMIIDGGLGQLNIIKKLLIEKKEFSEQVIDIQFIALGKGEARKRKNKISGKGEQIIVLNKNNTSTKYKLIYDTVDQITIKARDEAHRFANAHRKKQMQQERRQNLQKPKS